MREYVFLECKECGNRNYRTSRAARQGAKLELRKYCKHDRKHTLHVEKKK